LERLAALSNGVLDKLGHFLEDFSSLPLTLFGLALGRLTPAEKSPFGGPHVAGDLLTQRASRTGKRFDRLVHHSNIVGVADVSLQGGGVDANPARLNRSTLDQLLDQMLVETADPILAKSLIELNQSRSVGDGIHQGKMAKIPPRQPLSNFPLHFFVAQAPTKFQVHHPQIDPHRSAGTAQTRIENLFKGSEQRRIGQKLIDLFKLFIQLVERGIDKTIAKTHLLRYGSAHDLLFTRYYCSDPRKFVLFQ
jgi:hypothetical protein